MRRFGVDSQPTAVRKLHSSRWISESLARRILKVRGKRWVNENLKRQYRAISARLGTALEHTAVRVA